MTPFRSSTRIFTALILGGAMSGAAWSQTGNDQDRKALAETAKAIALTINANTQRTPGAPIAFESATSHDNFVELRYVANDAAAFARLKASVDKVRLDKASYYCNDSRIAYLKQGVVMHEILLAPNRSDKLDFIFDRESCDSLPRPNLADPKTLADFAITVAKAENETTDKNSVFRIDRAVAHQGVVDERFIFSPQANRINIVGFFTGYYCSKYREFISQGLVFHHSFVLPDGSPVVDFTIDKSRC